jgi:hypothetical protein
MDQSASSEGGALGIVVGSKRAHANPRSGSRIANPKGCKGVEAKSMTYADWIAAYAARTGPLLGRCRVAAEEMVGAFPELTIVRGHVWVPGWGILERGARNRMTVFRIGDRVRNRKYGWIGVVRAVECLACGVAYVDGQSACGHKAGGLTVEQGGVVKPWCLMENFEPEEVAMKSDNGETNTHTIEASHTWRELFDALKKCSNPKIAAEAYAIVDALETAKVIALDAFGKEVSEETVMAIFARMPLHPEQYADL